MTWPMPLTSRPLGGGRGGGGGGGGAWWALGRARRARRPRARRRRSGGAAPAPAMQHNASAAKPAKQSACETRRSARARARAGAPRRDVGRDEPRARPSENSRSALSRSHSDSPLWREPRDGLLCRATRRPGGGRAGAAGGLKPSAGGGGGRARARGAGAGARRGRRRADTRAPRPGPSALRRGPNIQGAARAAPRPTPRAAPAPRRTWSCAPQTRWSAASRAAARGHLHLLLHTGGRVSVCYEFGGCSGGRGGQEAGGRGRIKQPHKGPHTRPPHTHTHAPPHSPAPARACSSGDEQVGSFAAPPRAPASAPRWPSAPTPGAGCSRGRGRGMRVRARVHSGPRRAWRGPLPPAQSAAARRRANPLPPSTPTQSRHKHTHQTHNTRHTTHTRHKYTHKTHARAAAAPAHLADLDLHGLARYWLARPSISGGIVALNSSVWWRGGEGLRRRGGGAVSVGLLRLALQTRAATSKRSTPRATLAPAPAHSHPEHAYAHPGTHTMLPPHLQHLPDLRLEAHVQHAVGLVQNHVPTRLSRVALLQVVDEAPGVATTISTPRAARGAARASGRRRRRCSADLAAGGLAKGGTCVWLGGGVGGCRWSVGWEGLGVCGVGGGRLQGPGANSVASPICAADTWPSPPTQQKATWAARAPPCRSAAPARAWARAQAPSGRRRCAAAAAGAGRAAGSL